jgi:hypothetical protein
MSETKPPEETIISSTTSPTLTASGVVSGILRNLISLSATVLFFSFFLPWVSFLGGTLSGLDLQKHTDSYKLVWLLPAFAALTLILNIARQGTSLMRRLAGLCPFAILAYALNQMGSDLFRIVAIGGWLELIAGAALIFTPSVPKPTKPS